MRMKIKGKFVEWKNKAEELVIEPYPVEKIEVGDIVLARVRVLNVTAGRVLVNNYQETLGAIEINNDDLVALEPEECKCEDKLTTYHLTHCCKPAEEKVEIEEIPHFVLNYDSGDFKKMANTNFSRLEDKLNELIRQVNAIGKRMGKEKVGIEEINPLLWEDSDNIGKVNLKLNEVIRTLNAIGKSTGGK